MLRFSWVLMYIGIVGDIYAPGVMLLQIMEVFRRSIWMFLRVEWEVAKTFGEVMSIEMYKKNELKPVTV
jgi:hypothetical protein